MLRAITINGGIKKWEWRLRLLALLCLLPLTISAARAEQRQYEIEAAFLYNFLNYITWPGYQAPQDMKKVTICIEDHNPVEPYLRYIQKSRAQERTFIIHILPEVIDDYAIEGCQMVFIRDMEAALLDKLRSTAIENGVLLVSETHDFINDGGMIGLSMDEGAITIEIGNTILRQARFQVSSRLLHLASRVE